MIDVASFAGCLLPGGFRIVEIRLTRERLVDAIGREAVAQTTVNGLQFRLVGWAGLDEKEVSITLFHEVLEAAAVASEPAPTSIADFNEGDFERAARQMHDMFGQVSPDNLSRMLRHYGFGKQ